MASRKLVRRFGLATIIALIVGALPLASPALAAGSISLTTLGSAYTQDFNALATTGTANSDITLPNGWALYETGTSTRNNQGYAASNGSDNAGDVYSFGATSNAERAFGTLRSGTLVPVIGAAFTNDTGSPITSLAVAYTGEQWRAGVTSRNAADRLDFQLSTDANSLNDGTWVDENGLDFSSPNINAATNTLDGNAASNRASVSLTITGLNIPDGETFWIRWTDFDISSSDDGLAVDDFSLTPSGAPTVPNLTINDVSLNEGNSGTTTFTFTVSLSAPAGAGGATFDIATADGTATAPSDYTAKSLTGQTIAAGDSTYTFGVLVNGDTDPESDETFSVNVTNVTGANVVDGQGQATILNDDVAPPTADAGGPYSVSEGASVTLLGTGSDPGNGTLTYAWDLDDNGSFETPGQSVTFSAAGLDGPSSHTVRLQVTNTGGLTDVSQATVDVTNVPPSVDPPSVTPEPSTAGDSVTASASFSDPGPDAPYTCTLDYGDGSGALAGTVSGGVCTGPTHAYTTSGSYSVTVAVTDKDGATGTSSSSHTVVYGWVGFSQPIDNLPTINLAKAGSAIPVKFGLGGNQGLDIFAAGYPKSTKIACDTSEPQDAIEETITAGNSGLTYDATSDTYTYVWKTDRTWSGTCRQLVVKLVDGTLHSANFKFK